MKFVRKSAMVLNLDKCIGCHTLLGHLQERLDQPSWRRIRLVQQRRDQTRRRLSERTGETRTNGTAAGSARVTVQSNQRRGQVALLMRIFANPNLPEIDDYYEPFTFRLRAPAERARK